MLLHLTLREAQFLSDYAQLYGEKFGVSQEYRETLEEYSAHHQLDVDARTVRCTIPLTGSQWKAVNNLFAWIAEARSTTDNVSGVRLALNELALAAQVELALESA